MAWIGIAQSLRAKPKQRQRAAYDEYCVSRETCPFEKVDPWQIDKPQTARVPVAHIHSVIELNNAQREEVYKRHPRQADIETPERYHSGSVTPFVGTSQIPQTE